MSRPSARVLFVYWGRRGSLSRIAVEIADHLAGAPEPGAALSYSTANELADQLAALAPVTRPFRTFTGSLGAFTGLLHARRQIAALVADAEAEGIAAVVVLMSHVWTPLLGRRLARGPIRYVVVAHDASRHPGDRTGLVLGWLRRDLRHADAVVTLTRAVADQLTHDWGVPAGRISTVPHPVIDYGGQREPVADRPLRILFLGRIMTYKGLPLLAEAVKRLRAKGRTIELGVFGEGDLGEAASPLREAGAEIVNRWLAHDEIGAVLVRYDVMVLPYLEASQSGVAAAARGAGLPVVVTPVGGLAEQVRNEVDGLVAAAVSAEAIADCLARLDDDRALLAALAAESRGRTGALTAGEFADALCRIALGETA